MSDEFGVEPNAITFTTAMDAMAKGLQWEKAEELMQEMLQRGLEPNVITYNTLMNAYGASPPRRACRCVDNYVICLHVGRLYPFQVALHQPLDDGHDGVRMSSA